MGEPTDEEVRVADAIFKVDEAAPYKGTYIDKARAAISEMRAIEREKAIPDDYGAHPCSEELDFVHDVDMGDGRCG